VSNQSLDEKDLNRIGEKLRLAREARGWTRRDVSQRIKVTRRTVADLESDTGQFHDANVYLNGYSQNYARLLGLSIELETDAGLRDASELVAPNRRNKRIHRKFVERYTHTATYLIATVLVVLSVAAWFQQPLLVEPDQSIAAAVPTHAQPSTPVEGDMVKNDRAELPALPAALTPLHLGAVQEASILNTGVATIGANAASVAAPGATQSHLSLAVAADCWVEIRDETGRRLEYDLLRAGEHRRYTASGKLHVLLGNAAAVVLSVDDKAYDVGPYVNDNLASFDIDLHAGS